MLKVKGEIEAALDFMSFVYTKFGFTYKLFLSTRPKKYMGEIKDWDEAEAVSHLLNSESPAAELFCRL